MTCDDIFLIVLFGISSGIFFSLFLDYRNRKESNEREQKRALDNWRSKIELDLSRIREQLNRIEGERK